MYTVYSNMNVIHRLKLFFRLSLFVLILYGFFSSVPVFAQYSSGQMSEINQLQSQLNSISQKIQNYESSLKSINNNISLSQDNINNINGLIAANEDKIAILNTQISVINNQISSNKSAIQDTDRKIISLRSQFDSGLKTSYENSFLNPLFVAVSQSSVLLTLSDITYLNVVSSNQSSVLSQLKNMQYVLEQKLNLLSSNEEQLASTQASLQSTQNSLNNQESYYNNELSTYYAENSNIKNSISLAHNQYDSIVNQLSSMKVSGYTGGSGCTSGNWWYYNQQCYGTLQGLDGTSINMQYGCLISSIAMVATYETGEYYTPSVISGGTIFSGNYMETWSTALSTASLQPVEVSYDLGTINYYISQNTPVIVYLNAPNGEHWVVFYKNLGNGNYLINDPWYGSGLDFLGTGNGTHEYYDDTEIGDAWIMAKS